MNKKRQYKTYPKVFKEEAVALVLEQGYSVPEAAQSLNIKDARFTTGRRSTKNKAADPC